MRRARARVLNGRRRPLRDAVSEGQKKGRAFPYNNRALNTQVSQCNSNNSDSQHGDSLRRRTTAERRFSLKSMDKRMMSAHSVLVVRAACLVRYQAQTSSPCLSKANIA
ncbi:hypothetical protein NDU88_004301 [Pleurodeles waltl]|uniref:Uncharacterized protein n=1 Tax=Pleurodeles waltl TaxID=8319 RepID=A0AAV7T802_PLEWA|nr:hypothetical protein NDU88_004301 [Pleurodeles waltl]